MTSRRPERRRTQLLGHHWNQRRRLWERILTWTTASPFALDDHAVSEELSTPHTVGLTTLKGARETVRLQRAVPAQRLCEGDVSEGVREEEIRVNEVTRKGLVGVKHEPWERFE